MPVSEEIAFKVLHLQAQGMTRSFVARELKMSETSVRRCCELIMDKFEAANMAEATAAAFRQGFFKPHGWTGAPPLSLRRLEALVRLSQGEKDHEIAKGMDISKNTAHQHILFVMGVLRAQTRAQAVWNAFHWGILVP